MLRNEFHKERCCPNNDFSSNLGRGCEGAIAATWSSLFVVMASKHRVSIMLVPFKHDGKQTLRTCRKSAAKGCKEALVHFRPCNIAQNVRATCTMYRSSGLLKKRSEILTMPRTPGAGAGQQVQVGQSSSSTTITSSEYDNLSRFKDFCVSTLS